MSDEDEPMVDNVTLFVIVYGVLLLWYSYHKRRFLMVSAIILSIPVMYLTGITLPWFTYVVTAVLYVTACFEPAYVRLLKSTPLAPYVDDLRSGHHHH